MAQSHKRPSVRRVAASADVHGNAPALAAVLGELMLRPPPRDEAIAHAEQVVFSE